MPEYYKSRYLDQPIIYAQKAGRYSTIDPAGTVTEFAGPIPSTILQSLDPLPEAQARQLLSTRYHRCEHLDSRSGRDVFFFSSPVGLVTRACIEALGRMGWKTEVDEAGFLIAIERFKWRMLVWGSAQTFRCAVQEAEGGTTLTVMHPYVMGKTRPFYLHDRVVEMVRIMNDLLRDNNSLPVRPSVPAAHPALTNGGGGRVQVIWAALAGLVVYVAVAMGIVLVSGASSAANLSLWPSVLANCLGYFLGSLVFALLLPWSPRTWVAVPFAVGLVVLNVAIGLAHGDGGALGVLANGLYAPMLLGYVGGLFATLLYALVAATSRKGKHPQLRPWHLGISLCCALVLFSVAALLARA